MDNLPRAQSRAAGQEARVFPQNQLGKRGNVNVIHALRLSAARLRRIIVVKPFGLNLEGLNVTTLLSEARARATLKWTNKLPLSRREIAAMKKALILTVGTLALLACTSTSRADWTYVAPSAGPVYSGGPGACCGSPCCPAPCNSCCGRGLLGRIKDRICHTSSDCCTTSCAPPCGDCCNSCEPPCRHPILDKIRSLRCRCSPCDSCSQCPTTDCCPPRHRLFGFLHRNNGCCDPCCGGY